MIHGITERELYARVREITAWEYVHEFHALQRTVRLDGCMAPRDAKIYIEKHEGALSCDESCYADCYHAVLQDGLTVEMRKEYCACYPQELFQIIVTRTGSRDALISHIDMGHGEVRRAFEHIDAAFGADARARWEAALAKVKG